MRTLLSTIALTLLMSSITLAGLDTESKYDQTVAIYHFETTRDSGPREFHGNLQKGATLTDEGKINKGLKLPKDAYFGFVSDIHLGIVDNEHSIVAWVNLQNDSRLSISTLALDREKDSTLKFIGRINLGIKINEGVGEISGSIADTENKDNEERQSISAKTNEIGTNQWHHIAYTKYADTHTLFIDGEIIERRRIPFGYLGFVGGDTGIIISNFSETPISIDEVGIFETGFSIYEIKGLYNSTLETFLKAMPVDPQAKKATTWGEIKKRY